MKRFAHQVKRQSCYLSKTLSFAGKIFVFNCLWSDTSILAPKNVVLSDNWLRVAFDKYIFTITFWQETSPKSLPRQNKGSSQNIRWFLKTYYNHQLKINIAAKRSYQWKIIKFFFGRLGCEWVGILGEFSCYITFLLHYITIEVNWV